MQPDAITILLRIRQAREQRAETALQQAQAARARAVKACGRAEQAATAFAVARPEQEAAIYDTLGSGPVAVRVLLHAAADLSAIATHAVQLEQRKMQAMQHAVACADGAAAALRQHAIAQRGSLAVTSARDRLMVSRQGMTERANEMELEDLPRRACLTQVGGVRV